MIEWLATARLLVVKRGLIDSVHDAQRAGAQGRGAVHEGHGAGGRAGAGLAAATVAVNVTDWPKSPG